ncbi:MAG: hypothetical protein RL721_964 [Candidatus Eisenbacteria bacterium]|jgi:curli biogenesis system outer membrane secretion channel CsgG
MRIRHMGLAVLLALTTLTGTAAAGPRLFVNPKADMSFYQRIAVVPFANLTTDMNAGARVTRAFITELVIAGRFDLVEPGEFHGMLERIGGLPDAQGNADPKKLAEAATQAGATGLIRGAVTEYTVQRNGGDEVPVITFDVEMLDVATQQTVWRLTMSARGRGRMPVFGGANRKSFGVLTQEACEDAVRSLKREAF